MYQYLNPVSTKAWLNYFVVHSVPYEQSICLFANMIFIPLLIYVLPGLAQQVNQAILQASEPHAATCNASDIEHMGISSTCICGSGRSECPRLEYTCQNPTRTIRPNSGLIVPKGAKGACSDDKNWQCNSCYLWFNNLCSCIQKLRYSLHTNCKSSDPVPHNTPVWVLLEDQTLITTTQPLSGIEELDKAGIYANVGWNLGQRNYNRSTQALAMNSMATRTEEQIHIHVCNVKKNPCYPSGRTREILSCLDRSEYTKLKPVPLMLGDSKCRVASNQGEPIDNIAEDIIKEIQKKECSKYIGAGIITDSRNYTWACVSDSTTAAEYIFCN